jgi:hypothetical protein
MGNRNFRDPTYRERAQRARDNGHGKAHASWKRLAAARHKARNGNVGPGTWEHCMIEARSRWQAAREDAIEQFRADVLGDQWEGFEQ